MHLVPCVLLVVVAVALLRSVAFSSTKPLRSCPQCCSSRAHVASLTLCSCFLVSAPRVPFRSADQRPARDGRRHLVRLAHLRRRHEPAQPGDQPTFILHSFILSALRPASVRLFPACCLRDRASACLLPGSATAAQFSRCAVLACGLCSLCAPPCSCYVRALMLIVWFAVLTQAANKKTGKNLGFLNPLRKSRIPSSSTHPLLWSCVLLLRACVHAPLFCSTGPASIC